MASKALRKTGPYKLKHLKDAAGIALDLWSVDDPAKTYEANVCSAVAEGREVVVSFGLTPPQSDTPITAVSIGMPTSEMRTVLEAFGDIRERLSGLRFRDKETAERRLDVGQLKDMTAQNYRRDTAQIIRAVCGDDLAVLDFYKRPLVTLAIIEARPNEPLRLLPVMRITCPAATLSVMLTDVEGTLMEVKSNA